MSADASAEEKTVTVLLYSDDRQVRESLKLALGRRVAADLPEVVIIETATHAAVDSAMRQGGVDLVILDGEAAPAGGMGISKQFKEEIADCPPILLLVIRKDDAWLSAWSLADAVERYPIDPVTFPDTAARLLRKRLQVAGA
ncbi:response regulator [Raineyella sp.]|uniref:response regulator n=1 Tax=Raineyella sp. TaxID=1911550 RepID=UPI002B1F2127|nr:response regulator [Raineyella sp.]MEA5155206.1 response regulator [Raineyella sp.]